MNQSEACLHSGCSVHFRPSLHVSLRPSFRFSEGLVPRLCITCETSRIILLTISCTSIKKLWWSLT